MLRSITAIFVLSAAALLTACGGGSDGAQPEVTPQPEVVAPAQPTKPTYSGFQGTLLTESSAWGVGFLYLPELSTDFSELEGTGRAHLNATFLWEPPANKQVLDPIEVAQHAVVAWSQGDDPRGLYNGAGQVFWTNAIGAFVSESGLHLELWFMDSTYGNNAWVWGGPNDRCAHEVNTSEDQVGVNCLSDNPAYPEYLTPAPGFVLQYGQPYTLDLTIVTSLVGPSWLEAKLYIACPEACELVQQARLGIYPVQWLSSSQPMRASIARTPGAPEDVNVFYTVTR